MSDWTRAVAEVAWLFRRWDIPEPRSELVVVTPTWRRAWDEAMGYRGSDGGQG